MTESPRADSGRSTPMESCVGAAVILSANPIHDTGGGQRSAQLALELLDRDYAVLFVSHGKVTETVDLGIQYDHPRLTTVSLQELSRPEGAAVLEEHLDQEGTLVITQVPVGEWIPVLERARASGAVTIYDCIDRWDSELGRGWYGAESERRIASESDVLIASATELVHHVEHLAERAVSLLPNAYNSRIFRPDPSPARPSDLPSGERLGLYVGALWGGWLDWELVARAARALPETTFVFVGDRRREGRGLPANCVFLGLKKQTDLPGYLAHCDFAFLPWHADDVTQATSPLKVYEFVAMGLPVIGPEIETLRAVPGVRRFKDAADFVDMARTTVRSGLSAEDRSAMADFAASNSWVQRVDAMLALARGFGSEPRDAGQDGPTIGSARKPAGTGRRGRHAMLSVVIPAYNHERWIGRAVESVREQTLPAGELIVIDDGSSDRTAEIVSVSEFPGLRLIQQQNRGAHATINRAVALSRGDYVAILNSDDEFTPERLEHAWGVARSTGAALVIGSVCLIDGSGASLPADHDSARWYREARREPERARSLRQALLHHNFAVTTSNFFFHKELWRRLGGFGDYRYAHDLDFVLRALELGEDRVVYAPELEGVRYRVHGDNTILEDVERALGERDRLLRRIRSPWRRLRVYMGRAGARAAIAGAVDGADDPISGPAPSGAEAPDALTAGGSPLRLGLVVSELDEGGLEEVVALLAQALPAQGIEPHVLCVDGGGAVADRLTVAGLDVTVAQGRHDSLRRWMEDSAPQVLSTHFVALDALRVLAERGIPIFETVHNTYAWFDAQAWIRETEKLKHLTGTVAVSEIAAQYYTRFTGATVTPHVIPNGVHPARAASVPRAWARRHLRLPPDVPVLAHLGRVTLQKNVVGLMDVFARVLESEPSAHLVLAGSLGDRSYVRRVRRVHADLLRSGSVHLLPPVPHVGAVLSAADVYVSDSFFEGWSLAASEAAWNGLPLVLSECGSAHQLVGEDARRGRVVPNPLDDPLEVTWNRLRELPEHPSSGNESSFAEAVLELLERRDEWSERRQHMAAQARSRLSPERVSRAYAELFTKAVTP